MKFTHTHSHTQRQTLSFHNSVAVDINHNCPCPNGNKPTKNSATSRNLFPCKTSVQPLSPAYRPAVSTHSRCGHLRALGITKPSACEVSRRSQCCPCRKVSPVRTPGPHTSWKLSTITRLLTEAQPSPLLAAPLALTFLLCSPINLWVICESLLPAASQIRNVPQSPHVLLEGALEGNWIMVLVAHC